MKKKDSAKNENSQELKKIDNNHIENSFFVQATNHQFNQFKLGFEKIEADIKEILALNSKKDSVLTKRSSRFKTLKDRFK